MRHCVNLVYYSKVEKCVKIEFPDIRGRMDIRVQELKIKL